MKVIELFKIKKKVQLDWANFQRTNISINITHQQIMVVLTDNPYKSLTFTF